VRTRWSSHLRNRRQEPSDEARKFGVLFHASSVSSRFPSPSSFRANSRLLFSLEVENIADFPGEGRCRREDERDKQVLEHNKGVSIRNPVLFICKPRGWPSVRIISSDFHDRVYGKWLVTIRVHVIARDDSFIG